MGYREEEKRGEEGRERGDYLSERGNRKRVLACLY